MSTGNQPRPKKRKKRSSRIKTLFFLLFWMMILVSFGGLIVYQAGIYNDMHAVLLRIRTDITRETAVRDELNMQIMFFDSDAHVEQLARERLGMVRTYEIVFRNIAGN